jgi:hypothetical protein
VIADIAVHGVPFRAKVGKALTKLGKALQVPRATLFKTLKVWGIPWIRRFPSMRRAIPQMAVGVGLGGPITGPTGAAVAGVTAAHVAGRGIERLGRIITADSTGGLLHSIAYYASAGLGKRIEKVLRLLARGPMAYRLGVYALLKDPEFRDLAEKQMKGPER